MDAIGEPAYTFEATTLTDSTSSQSQGWTSFKVVASMEGGIFDYHEEGYSVDNIAPRSNVVYTVAFLMIIKNSTFHRSDHFETSPSL